MPARITLADPRSLLDHGPDAGDEIEIASVPVVALKAPRNHGRLVHGRRLPFGNAIDRVLLEPVKKRMVSGPHLVQPKEDPPADLGVAQPLHCISDPERIARPAIRAQAPVEPGGNGAVL